MADDTNTAEREAVARAIWALMREHEDRCDEELEDLSRYHPVWEYADAARASLAEGAPAGAAVLCWVNEDELPEGLTQEAYSALFPHSRVDMVRMFPVFGPTAQATPAGAGTWAHLKLMMEESAWGGQILLSDALANIADFAASHPSPLEGMAGWISVDERLPEPGQNVAFVVRANICGSFRLLNGRVLGGRFLPGEGFSIPGLCVDASHWMPLPAPPLPASEAKEL